MHRQPHTPRHASSGIALVLVLGFLVIISVLLISFFSSVQTELTASRSYANEVSARQLADSAASIAMGQISDGTKSYEIPRDPTNASSPPGGARLTWASQPGLIRTWKDDGKPGRTFKLYSSKNMVEDEAAKPYDTAKKLTEEVPADWPAKPALYTDVNAPVLVVDPNGAIRAKASAPLSTANYPILDPLAQESVGGPGSVEGFTIAPPPGYGGPAKITPGYDPTKPVRNKTPNPAAMPVVWLYVLQNGTITVPNEVRDNGQTGAWTNLSNTDPKRPTKQNPIVGRIAFWTDDETCKVNVNTAAEGVFWDRPWTEGSQEHNYARVIPAQNEFQRYAGHPSMTCLSAVFNRVPGLAVTAGTPTWAQVSPYYDFLAPRVANGGTKAGTTAATAAIKLKNERLYASLDEMIFKVNAKADERTPIAGNVPGLTRPVLERAKFFLTATSRAPEVNVFGLPRIALWPLQANVLLDVPAASQAASVAKPEAAPWRNAKDKLIAFCTSTTRVDPKDAKIRTTYPYYFQRYSIYDRRKDGRGTPQVPPPSCYRWDLDYRSSLAGNPGIPRNARLYEYLQRLTGQPIPGVGKSFAAKYPSPGAPLPSDRDQILTEMFDMIRSGVNSYSTGLKLTGPVTQPGDGYDYVPSRGAPRPGETQVVPFTHPNGTRGFGRFHTITEAAIQFYCSRGHNGTVGGVPAFVPDEMRAVLILEPFNPSIGPASWSHHVRYRILGLNTLKVRVEGGGDTLLSFPAQPENLITSRVGYSGGGHITAFMGLQSFFRYWRDGGRDQNKTMGGGNPETGYPFYTQNPIQIPAGRTKFDFLGSPQPIEIQIFTGYPTTGAETPQLVQTIKMTFPAVTGLPLPNDRAVDYRARIQPNLNDPSSMPDYRDPATGIIRPGDVVRSVEAKADGVAKGDLRFFCALGVVPDTYFTPTPGYASAANRIVHSLRQTCWTDRQIYVDYTNINGKALRDRPPTIDTAGKLVAAASYHSDRTPTVPRGLVAALTFDGKPGDWDNGIGYLEDGPLINKPDEGNLATGESSYFTRGTFTVESGITFSPNRQVSSGVMFGSLPTGIYAGKPWQTLLFCAFPSAGDSSYSAGTKAHFGATNPPDHLLLDLFTMPIVEPYAISEPFSTAGKVNLNYQIAPFTYIRRDTALRAALKSTLVMAIPTTAGLTYKIGGGGNFRKAIDMKETMSIFERRLNQDNRPFFSASEICEMPLVPQGTPAAGIATFWTSNALTGDNAREYPYGHIYPRVTTRSNSFTVHMRVQTLRKAVGSNESDWLNWREDKDQIVSEYRGSTLIERYVDATDPNLPDFADPNTRATLDEFYKFRIVSTKKFTP